MTPDHELFRAHLQKVFGPEHSIRKMEASDGGPPVHVFVYRDTPEPGMITGVTYGLSWHAHPEWKFSRPEMIIAMNSPDEAWAFAAGFFAASFRGEKRFSYGDVFTTEVPLAGDTQMDGVLIFAQSILDASVESVQLNDCKVHFSQFYPIHRAELPLYERIGLEQFWKHKGFAMYEPGRRPIRQGWWPFGR